MDRRTFLRAGATSAAIILTPGLLMPVRKIITPIWTGADFEIRPRLNWSHLTEAQKNYWMTKMVDEVALAPRVKWQSR